jgi:O-antigen ligase
LFFVVVDRSVHPPQDLYRARGAIVIGFLVGAAVNLLGLLVFAVARAGTAWNVLVGNQFIGSPNEAGFSMTFLWALMLALPVRRWQMAALMMLSLAFLVATASRSGLLAWVTFVAVWAIVSRKGWLLLLPLVLGLIYPFFPEALTGRLMRTLLLQRGSFEAYSTLVRVYAWHTALNVFRHFPILGVGYACFRFFSYQYNGLSLNLGTAENVILETATGMGLVGLLAIFWLAASIGRLARSVLRSTTKGSPAWNLARMSTPMFLANVVANMTADNLSGIVSAAQMAVWCAFLVAASRIDQEARAADAAAAVPVAA